MDNNEKSFLIDSSVDSINIDFNNIDVEIETIDNSEDNINLVDSELIYGGKVEVIHKGKQLRIKETYGGNNFIKIQGNSNCVIVNNNVRVFPSTNDKITILKMTLVKDNKYKIMIKNKNGDITVNNLKTTELSINTINGDVVIDGISADKLDIETVNGDVTLYNVDVNSTKLNSVGGDCYIEVLESIMNYLTQVSTINGDCEQIKSESTEPEIANERKLSVDSVTGDIKILYKGRKN